MKKSVRVILLLSLLVESVSAFGNSGTSTNDAATTGDQTNVEANVTYRNDGRLDARDVNALFAGSIPSFRHTDRFYSRGNGSRTCRSDWNRVRSLPVQKKTVSVGFRVLKQSAANAGLSESKLRRILATFLANQSEIPNQDYISVIDFDKSSSRKRMFIINLRNGTVTSHKVAHGSGSGGRAAVPTRFSNANGTHASSLGCSLATFNTDTRGRRLKDGHGRHKLLFQGLESTNDQQCNRAIIMHPATYVSGGGRSHGCPAVTPEDKQSIYNKISGGGLVCAYRDGNSTTTRQRVEAEH